MVQMKHVAHGDGHALLQRMAIATARSNVRKNEGSFFLEAAVHLAGNQRLVGEIFRVQSCPVFLVYGGLPCATVAVGWRVSWQRTPELAYRGTSPIWKRPPP